MTAPVPDTTPKFACTLVPGTVSTWMWPDDRLDAFPLDKVSEAGTLSVERPVRALPGGQVPNRLRGLAVWYDLPALLGGYKRDELFFYGQRTLRMDRHGIELGVVDFQYRKDIPASVENITFLVRGKSIAAQVLRLDLPYALIPDEDI